MTQNFRGGNIRKTNRHLRLPDQITHAQILNEDELNEWTKNNQERLPKGTIIEFTDDQIQKAHRIIIEKSNRNLKGEEKQTGAIANTHEMNKRTQ